MALTASSLIDSAIKRSFGATGTQKIPKSILLEELSYQDQLIVQMFSQIAPDLLATTTGTISVTDAGNLAGYALQSGIHYRDFVHVDTTNEKHSPITILRRQDREAAGAPPTGMIRMGASAAVFAPIDPLSKRWLGTSSRGWYSATDGHTVSYSYVPLPTAITSLSGTLKSPDMAREAILSSLELTILLSAPMPNETRIQASLAKRQGMMDSLRMQAYKFVGPQGQKVGGGSSYLSDSAWVSGETG